ncbi:hypothetical protein O181_022368 [Austropuccinia psidii MF-1]|uniref:Integrase catalytic domain-containing protein n=1 Tax=Austropuccinia psidii MF-1 TaxID=1389203 RepID=A0A9Q3CGQ1_9BASI|nr:hypothetical protein [Austropuccinia psidii MF-1]
MPPLRMIVEAPGDVLAVDLMGPFPQSINKFIYTLIIQDHFSSIFAFIPLRAKSEAAGHVVRWILQFERLTSKKVKRLQSDNGGEFNSKSMEEFLAKEGIVHEKTVPYEHHQNGNIEQTNRMLAELGWSILIQAKLPTSFWTYAFRQAAWVFNRVLHAGQERTPYELVINRKPDLTMLRVFGCISILHNMVQRKDLTPKAKKMIHLGVAQDSQGWVFWDPQSGQWCRSSLVVFDEEDFFLFPAQSTTINQISAKNVYDGSVVQEIEAQDSAYNLIQISSSFCIGMPSTYHEAVNGENGKAWEEACREELRSLEDMRVWNEVRKPTDKQILGTRWVFTTKSNQQGDVICYKARLVVQGHRQVKGINFEETFAPTPTFETLWSIFAIASAYKWRVTTFDVTTAYLHSQLDEDIYIKAPLGVAVGPGMVFKLNKALYGLKQAGRCWWLHIKSILQVNEEDQSTYVYRRDGHMAILWIHVDDGVMATSDDTLWETLKRELTGRLKLKWDKEINSIVGIEKIRKGDTFVLKQTSLIDKLLSNDDNNFTAYEPLPQENLKSNKAVQMDREYLSKIGMILYLAQATRPDIMYAVNYLARFAMNTDDSNWRALNHLISYI